MVNLRVVWGPDVERVNAFYADSGSGTRADPADVVLVAEDGGDVVGAVRLCTESGHLVLRGMIVRQDRQRKGIGRQILVRLEELTEGRDCYLIGHDYLAAFYGSIGFVPVPAHEAPRHLQERQRVYLERGLPEVIMKRSVARSRGEYTAANRMAWNQTAPVHEQHKFARLLDVFRRPGYSLLDPVETVILKEIGLEGKAVAVLQQRARTPVDQEPRGRPLRGLRHLRGLHRPGAAAGGGRRLGLRIRQDRCLRHPLDL